jgi:hypothetical protein
MEADVLYDDWQYGDARVVELGFATPLAVLRGRVAAATTT